MIADSAMELHAARLMVYECAWRADRGEDVRNLSYMVKIVATEAASRIVDRSIQLHGGLGLMKELPLEWWYRQLRSIRITEGDTRGSALAHGPASDPQSQINRRVTVTCRFGRPWHLGESAAE